MGTRIDRAKVRDVIDFCACLKHVKGHLASRPGVPAKPLYLDEWQIRGFIEPVFGHVDEDGYRVVKKAVKWIPKKNTKSTLGAALALYLLGWDDEPGAEVASCAADKFQARIVFETAKDMAMEADYVVRSQLQWGRDKIIHLPTRSTYEVLSSDVKTKHGPNYHGVIFDEIHAQPNRELWDTVTPAGAARKQPLVLGFSTAGKDIETLGGEQYLYSKKIVNGDVVNPAYHALIYEAPKDADWTDENVWRACNPGLGSSVQMSFLRAQFAEAKEIPSMQASFRRLHLNQWVEDISTWIDMEEWDKCQGTTHSPPAGSICYGGIDLASVRDMCSWVLVFPMVCEDGEKRLRIQCRLWVPEARLTDKENMYAAQYRAWAAHGFLQTVPGNVMEYGPIERQIYEDANTYFIDSIHMDRYFQGLELHLRLQDHGLDVYGFGQGYASMSAPMKAYEAMISRGQVDHTGNPVLRWQATNMASVSDDAGNIKPSKKKATGPIDGQVGTIQAVGRYLQREGGLDPDERNIMPRFA